tara:strand:- start:794 stop:1177 length:384 start_codon:yes stop_codon:yes gene_type:complete
MLMTARVLMGLIAALHLFIAYFEMFAWETTGPRVFSTFPPELFGQTTVLAANQGIYTAFLAVGLIWAVCITNREWQRKIGICFFAVYPGRRSGGRNHNLASDHDDTNRTSPSCCTLAVAFSAPLTAR